MTKAKSKMPSTEYNGFTIYQETSTRWKIGLGVKGFYHGTENSLIEAKERVDRIIKTQKVISEDNRKED